MDWFEKWTLPSVVGQSCKDFQWLVFFAEDTPADVLKRAESWPAKVVLVPPCKTPNYCIHMVRAAIRLAVLANATTYNVAQVRLDNDDRIAFDFVETLRAHLVKGDRWISFNHGSMWKNGGVWHRFKILNPMMIYVGSVTELYTACCFNTNKVNESEVKVIEGQPMWQVMIHDNNIINHTVPVNWRKPMQSESTLNRFRT